MLGLVFAKRPRDEHWWDADELVRARNVEFEAKLDELIEDYGVPDPRETPKRRKGDHDMLPSNGGWQKFIVQIGVPAAICLFLVYMVAVKFDAKQDATLDLMRSHTAATGSLAVMVERSDRQQDVIIALLRAQCVNSAKNPGERLECLRAGQ